MHVVAYFNSHKLITLKISHFLETTLYIFLIIIAVFIELHINVGLVETKQFMKVSNPFCDSMELLMSVSSTSIFGWFLNCYHGRTKTEKFKLKNCFLLIDTPRNSNPYSVRYVYSIIIQLSIDR